MIRFRSIQSKILFTSLSAIFLTAAVLVVVVFIEKVPLKMSIDEELDKLAKSETSKIARDVFLMCRAQDDLIQKKLEENGKTARFVLENNGPVLLGSESVVWNASNLMTNAVKPIRLARMIIGTKEANSTGEQTDQTIIDKIHDLVGVSCSLFQRMNESGDLLRIASSDEDALPVGTYLPSLTSTGTSNPAIASVMSGNPYYGRLNMGTGWYFSALEPIFDSAQNLIGALFVGMKEESLQNLRKGIMEIQVGKTGYVYVLRGTGDQKGNYVISKNGERDNENVWDSPDSNGRYFIQSIIQKAVTLKNGTADYELYPWKNTGENVARTKIVAFTYFEPWDWVIGAGTYQDDFQDTQLRVDNSLGRLVLSTLVIAMVLLAIFGCITFFIVKKITTPLRQATSFAQKVAKGDLSQRLEVTQNDETGMLGNALNEMVNNLSKVSVALTCVANGDLTQSVDQTGDLADAVNQMSKDLNEIMMQIQNSAQQVAASSEQLSSSAQSLSSSTTEQASALEETSASIEQLASSVDQNAKNSSDANNIIGKAAKDAEQGGEAVVETVQAMRKIAQTIAIVNDIADQTNLLALNAAIEAARAGDMGKGFAVVAVEVRKLAERSQQAAKEISELAANSVNRAETAGELIQQIVPDIQRTARLMEEINMTCQEQTSGANQIRQAVNSLDQVTQENSASSEESASASEELDSQAQLLQQLVARFKIDIQQAPSDRILSVGNNGFSRDEKKSPNRMNRVSSESRRDYVPRDYAAPSRISDSRRICSVNKEDELEFKEF